VVGSAGSSYGGRNRGVSCRSTPTYYQFLNRAVVIDRERLTADCVRGVRFLEDLTEDERTLARDKYQREQAVAERLRAALG
jgi:hypothetical protein